MGYVLLTGATGLLGTYLVRDLLRAGTPLALLVRPTRWASARQRVETLVEHWEKQTGYALPRPVVLEGHLLDGALGLDEAELRWASVNCEAVIHNAASLTFYSEGPQAEPWLTNLQGTRNLLEFCRGAKIRQFHHVSTAYVCGKRRGVIRENELDDSQGHGNDYEVTKFQAEQMVRGADFLDRPTVYRPGIIFGDSETGYTTTYHGFYVPLKLVSTLINKIVGFGVPVEEIRAEIQAAGKRLLEVMGLTGDEHKNFVPVDWVSAATVELFRNARHHGHTYHLTPRNRTLVSTVQDVFQRVALEYVNPTTVATEDGGGDWENFEKYFFDQMGVYRAYWQDDPEFDGENITTALPDQLCPEVDEAMLMRASRFAVESKFGWPRPPVVKPEFDVHARLQGLFDGEAPLTAGSHQDMLGANAVPRRAGSGGPVDRTLRSPVNRLVGDVAAKSAHVGLQVNGCGGGQWEITLADGHVVSAASGISRRCTATFYLNSKTFRSLADHELSAAKAIDTGRVVIEGNGVPMEQLTRALQTVATNEFAMNESANNQVANNEAATTD